MKVFDLCFDRLQYRYFLLCISEEVKFVCQKFIMIWFNLLLVVVVVVAFPAENSENWIVKHTSLDRIHTSKLTLYPHPVGHMYSNTYRTQKKKNQNANTNIAKLRATHTHTPTHTPRTAINSILISVVTFVFCFSSHLLYSLCILSWFSNSFNYMHI